MNNSTKAKLGATMRWPALVLAAVLIPCMGARANIRGPYTPDANTLFLLHFDEPAGSSVTTNVGLIGGNFYTVTNTTGGTAGTVAQNGLTEPPPVSTMLGKTSYTNVTVQIGFGNCVSGTNTVDPSLYLTTNGLIGYDGNKNAAYDADVQGGPAGPDAIAMTNLNIGNPLSAPRGNSPFTIEALVCPASIGGVQQEILCTDDYNGTRGFQFRINNNSQLEFNFIGAPGSGSKTAAIPTGASDPNRFVAGNWYHVAVTYNGTNLFLYWTLLSSNSMACNQIGGPYAWTSTNSNGNAVCPLIVGDENRGSAQEDFKGLIDEVRISSVCRSPGDMMFTNAGVAIVQQPASQNIDYFQPVTFSLTVSSPTPVGYRWRFNGTPIPDNTATNFSITIPSVDLNVEGDYDCVITNTGGYANTSSIAHLIVGADHFLAHRWNFITNGAATDLVGGANGTLNGNATVTNGSLVLDGTTNTYMVLPSYLIYNTNTALARYPAVTFEFWASYGSSGNNDRVFDFGNTNFVNATVRPPENYVFFSPHAGANHVLGFTPTTSESQISATAAGNLDGQSGVYVACVVDPPDNIMSIYTNGVLETNAALSASLSSIIDQKCWIGRSLFNDYNGDANFNGSLDELRIYNGALSPASIAQSFAQGPDVPLNAGAVAIVIQPTNTTGAVGFPVSFIPVIVGKSPVFQWYENSSPILGATNVEYTFTPTLDQNGHVFQVLATNVVGGTNYNVASSNATLTVIVPPTLVWLGQNSSTWDTSTLNWTNVSTATLVPFSAFASAIFDDRGAGHPTVNLTQALNPVTVTVNSTTTYSFTSSGGNGSLTGSGSLIKSNTDTLIIDVTNNMTGPVLIAGGTVQLGNGDTFGSLNGPVTNNASLVLDRSDATVMPSPIYGTGAVSMNSGNVTASGANFYTGDTAINSGVTLLANAAGLGATNGSITVNSGELYITANVDLGLNPLILGGTGVSSAGALRKGGAGTTTCYGTVTLMADTTLNVDGGATLNLTNSAGISGPSPTYLTLNGSGAGNIAGPLSLGLGGLTVNGGTWTVAPSNNFTGGVVLYGGALRITGPQSLGPTPVSFNSAQIYMNGGTLEAGANVTLNDGNTGITLDGNSGIAKDANVTLTISNQIANTSQANLTNMGPGTLVLNGPNPFAGTLYMDTGSQTANDGTVVIANNAAIANIPAETGNPQIIFRNNNGGSSTLALDGTLGSITVAPDIALAGRNAANNGVVIAAIENLAGSNTISGGFTLQVGGAYPLQSDGGILNLTANFPEAVATNVTSARTITFQGAGIITMSGAIQDVVNSLTSTNIPINIVKIGTGVLNLPAANAYSGTTTISNGTLVVSGSLSNGPVSVMGSGILAGNGVINGPVTDSGGNGIYPTDFTGSSKAQTTLTISNTLTMNGTVTMCISKTGGTRKSDLITGVTTANYGGALVITNVTTDANVLTTNDTFTLFSASAHSSNFATIVGSPGAGLGYSFNPANGVLSVVVGGPGTFTSTPGITNLVLNGASVVIAGTNGQAGDAYYLLQSTNVALPLSQWTAVATNVLGNSGSFTFVGTNVVTSGARQQFYILSNTNANH